jgi:molybdenum cofactor guanylyltransferase
MGPTALGRARTGSGRAVPEPRALESGASFRISIRQKVQSPDVPTAAILAGGLARRFDGRDKSALVVAGRSIFEHQIAALTELSDDILYVAAHPAGQERSRLDDTPGVRIVHDRVSNRGPLAGLDAAFSRARHDVVVIVACDMPFVSAPLLAHLVALTEGADAAVPLTARGYHPLCAAYARSCHASVERRLAEGRLAVAALLDDLRVRSVTQRELETFGDPGRLLANVNTSAEYTKLIEQEREWVA